LKDALFILLKRSAGDIEEVEEHRFGRKDDPYSSFIMRILLESFV